MSRHAQSVRLAAAVLALLVCAGCSTSTLVQSSEVLPLAQRVVDYHDEHLPADQDNSDALAQSAALIATLRREEVSQSYLWSIAAPVLERYARQVEDDPDLIPLERRTKLDDVKTIRKVAGLSDG